MTEFHFAERRVAATGAAGGIGHAIVTRLVSEGAEVYGLDRRVPDDTPAGVQGIEMDLSSPDSVAEVVSRLYAADSRPIGIFNSFNAAAGFSRRTARRNPDGARHERYRSEYETFSEAYRSLEGWFNRL